MPGPFDSWANDYFGDEEEWPEQPKESDRPEADDAPEIDGQSYASLWGEEPGNDLPMPPPPPQKRILAEANRYLRFGMPRLEWKFQHISGLIDRRLIGAASEADIPLRHAHESDVAQDMMAWLEVQKYLKGEHVEHVETVKATLQRLLERYDREHLLIDIAPEEILLPMDRYLTSAKEAAQQLHRVARPVPADNTVLKVTKPEFDYLNQVKASAEEAGNQL